jgi:hypothetical protein
LLFGRCCSVSKKNCQCLPMDSRVDYGWSILSQNIRLALVILSGFGPPDVSSLTFTEPRGSNLHSLALASRINKFVRTKSTCHMRYKSTESNLREYKSTVHLFVCDYLPHTSLPANTTKRKDKTYQAGSRNELTEVERSHQTAGKPWYPPGCAVHARLEAPSF